jgi:Putative zinc-finger
MNGDLMLSRQSHLTDEEVLLAADGELPPARTAQVAAHLAECWPCRARTQEIEQAIVDFVRLHRGHLDPLLPSPAGPRALLKAQLAAMSSERQQKRWFPAATWQYAAALLLLAVSVAGGYHYWMSGRSSSPLAALPEPSLTPGAVATIDREQVCRSAWPKNRGVPLPLQRKVFEEYGIESPEPRAYEVDYLITPGLGGADDIRNLWPQSYSATAWNARVKDTLEDHLHELVCSGQLDLVTAQRDISSDWIAAYQKYFHTKKPLETAR